ncbi:hypothetical protein H312_00280 [Anncaliia algerae PRA339]|uniref:Uncharacterized protein n=2 Tax=Anncaliia algerae PRA339 TaxID=1288291 RepID=A0A059F573_9MICR|nr:hypothetical protein H312_00280 [Anncaliia algerae PRA339]
MALVKCLKGQNSFCYIHKSFYKNILFDFPGEIYGKNHCIPTLKTNNKPLKLVIPDIRYEHIDCVFVSSSESLGIFFLPKHVTVYVTEPVLDQLMLKISFLNKLKVYYEEEEHQGRLVNIKNYSLPNIVRIRLNQSFCFSGIVVKALSAGTNIGWVNYTVKDKFLFFYVKSISFDRRFSSPSPSILPDYLFLNRSCDNNSIEEICCTCKNVNSIIPGLGLNDDFFTKDSKIEENKSIKLGRENFINFLIANSKKKNVVICEMNSFFIELLFFAFLALKGMPIYILMNEFNSLRNKLNFYGEFLNTTMQDRMYKGLDPLPLDNYENFFIINSIKDINHTSYVLFTPVNLSIEADNLASINSLCGNICFFISFEASLEEIKSNFDCNLFKVETQKASHCLIHDHVKNTSLFAEKYLINYSSSDGYIQLHPIQSIFIQTKQNEIQVELQNTHLIQMNTNLILEGRLIESDKFIQNNMKTSLIAREFEIKNIFERESYFLHKDWFYFPKLKIKIKLEEKIIIEEY